MLARMRGSEPAFRLTRTQHARAMQRWRGHREETPIAMLYEWPAPGSTSPTFLGTSCSVAATAAPVSSATSAGIAARGCTGSCARRPLRPARLRFHGQPRSSAGKPSRGWRQFPRLDLLRTVICHQLWRQVRSAPGVLLSLLRNSGSPIVVVAHHIVTGTRILKAQVRPELDRTAPTVVSLLTTK